MYYGRNERQSWRDTMQVCMNGHVINAAVQNSPEFNKEFCTTCGAKTITKCPNCSSPIPGDLQDTGVLVLGFRTPAPGF